MSYLMLMMTIAVAGAAGVWALWFTDHTTVATLLATAFVAIIGYFIAAAVKCQPANLYDFFVKRK